MELFSRQETREYFSRILQKVKEKIDTMTDAEITGSDIEEWREYYYSHYEIQPIVLVEEGITQSLAETKVKQYNPFGGYMGERQYIDVDGYRITYSIPFDGEPDLLDLQPGSRILSRFECDRIIRPSGEDYGSLVISFEFERRSLEQQGEKMVEYVSSQFEREFSSYRTMIGYVNAEALCYNQTLQSTISKMLDKRKDRASSFSKVSQMLEIPMRLNKNAPNTTPITLKRTSKVPVKKPEKKVVTEYSIKDSDYENINRIIYMCCSAMEKTARSHIDNNEEELRDFILATLQTHYDNAGGETFRKIGKTDISIEFDNQAAFIGECKVWRGEKIFSEAVQQVQNYSTWKDTKISVIIFNKENKSFQPIIKKISNWVASNTKSFSNPAANIWECRYYREDMQVEIRLNISVFDLYVDQTQIQDKRFGR